MMTNDEIIAAQKDQLMELRAKLKRAVGGSTFSMSEIRLLMAENLMKNDGKTIGLQIHEELRSRLLLQKDRLGGKNYRQIVKTAVELGLRTMEGAKDDESAVAKVQEVQRPHDSGNGANRPAA